MGQNKSGAFRVGRGLTDHVFVDVDGTLLLWPTAAGAPAEHEVEALNEYILGNRVNAKHLPRSNVPLVLELTKWYDARKRAGGDPVLVIWSMGGPGHAAAAREYCAFPPYMSIFCMGKPDVIVDDATGETLARKHTCVQPDNFTCPEAA